MRVLKRRVACFDAEISKSCCFWPSATGIKKNCGCSCNSEARDRHHHTASMQGPDSLATIQVARYVVAEATLRPASDLNGAQNQVLLQLR